jgi:hypothetical protein
MNCRKVVFERVPRRGLSCSLTPLWGRQKSRCFGTLRFRGMLTPWKVSAHRASTRRIEIFSRELKGVEALESAFDDAVRAKARAAVFMADNVMFGNRKTRPDVRFTADSGNSKVRLEGPLCTNIGSEKPYSITSSARARIDCGTCRPNDFAVLRLTTSSNFVGGAGSGSFVSAASVLRRRSDASQSPAHSFIPLTVPTSSPVGPFDVICSNGLPPTFGTFGV